MSLLAGLLGPRTALFLDFDGTLVDIAPQPDAVVVPGGLTHMLQRARVALGGAVAVISGRPIAQIDAFLAPLQLPAAGVHGLERRCADGRLERLDLQPLDHVRAAAQRLAQQHPGLRVEDKGGSIALHYRQAPQFEEACIAAMQAAVDASPGLSLLRGKMVVEAKPGGASKGHAIEAFLQEPPFAGRVPVFIGDDVTDEVGFGAVQRAGGVGVKVGQGASVATHRLETPHLMREELEHAFAARAQEPRR